MAKVKLYPRSTEISVDTRYSLVDLSKHNATMVRYTDQNDMFDIVLKGKNFKMDGDQLVGGTITEIKLIDGDGDPIKTITDIKLRAKDLEYTEQGDPSSLWLQYSAVMGKDVITGSAKGDHIEARDGADRISAGKGHDVLVGGKGNDVMWGGAGSDQFAIGHQPDGSSLGKDIIKDFDPETEKLLIDATDLGNYDLIRKGNDTLVFFDKHTSALLLGVRPKELSDDNFEMFV